jgi:hypothetical protein
MSAADHALLGGSSDGAFAANGQSSSLPCCLAGVEADFVACLPG